MNASTMARAAGAALFVAAALAAQTPPSDEFLQLEPVLQQALRKAGPFVVTVETYGGTRQAQGSEGAADGEGPPKPRQMPKWEPKPRQEDPDDADKKKNEKKKPLVASGFAQAQGKTSGVVLTADGWVLVSRFALALEPTTVLITVPGRGTFHAVRGGEDTSRGIALVKIDAQDLPVPDFVHPDQVHVGQWAFALGRTFAADEPTVHLGIVSAKKRLFGRALQIDAYTSPANYGGAVVDVQGRVLGIAVPLSPSGRNAGVEWYDSGIGFAVTIADIQPLLARMQQGEVLQRGWLGVQLATAWLGPGAKIDGTPKDGVAAKAGLRKGDVIQQVDGVEVMNGPHFQMLLSSRLGGDPITLTVRQKDGDVLTVGPLTLADAPWSEQKQSKDAELPASFPLPKEPEGR
ncbi:MAG: trypsin-like peptidase domain-containing protein [Planctomycetes bacterium]|nr:trypsin-like peptidase domain-containing protein [Planctomycetota bacterium]